MMSENEKLYQRLKKNYTDEEMAESFVFPSELSVEKETSAKLREFIRKKASQQSVEERIQIGLIGLKYRMEDYISEGVFLPEKSFGKHVEEYVWILKRTKKKLSEELGIHYTRLSRIINDREEPNVELTFRLEKHCGNLINALTWWRLASLKQESFIREDESLRKREGAQVTNAMKFQE